MINNAILGVIAGSGPLIPGDPYWANVSALLHFDGGNGSTTFVDSGPLGLAVTRGSPAIQTNAIAKYGPSCVDIAGSGGFARISTLAPFQFGSGDFTVEAWVYRDIATGATEAICCYWRSSPLSLSWYVGSDNSGRLTCYYSTNGSSATFPSTVNSIPVDAWTHVAVSRQGSSLRFFLNGVLDATHAIGTANLFNSAAAFTVGNDGNTTPAGQRWIGGIDEMRITKGVARYTASFAPPTRAFPNYGV